MKWKQKQNGRENINKMKWKHKKNGNWSSISLLTPSKLSLSSFFFFKDPVWEETKRKSKRIWRLWKILSCSHAQSHMKTLEKLSEKERIKWSGAWEKEFTVSKLICQNWHHFPYTTKLNRNAEANALVLHPFYIFK